MKKLQYMQVKYNNLILLLIVSIINIFLIICIIIYIQIYDYL